jgi:hypothetical protein
MKLLAFVAIPLVAVIGVKAQIRPPPLIEPLFNVTLNVDPEVIGPLSVPGGLQTGGLASLCLAAYFHNNFGCSDSDKGQCSHTDPERHHYGCIRSHDHRRNRVPD